MRKGIITFFLIIFCVFFLRPTSASAQNISIIRDTEIENFLRDITDPILKVANLDRKNIKIYIVEDQSINAFVAGGQNIFINTGLITKYNNPNVLIGVLAHEVGHIASGHLVRSGEEFDKIGNALILTYLAGFAAALSSSPDAAYAIIMGGNQISQRLALKHTRNQEEAADRLALKYLNQLNYSPAGLLKLLEYFGSQEVGFKKMIDEFALTHPISKKRINFIKANIADKKYHDIILNQKELTTDLKRINVKIKAFFNNPNQTLRKYFGQNNFLARYGKSIAYFKKGDIDKSLKELDKLISENYKDPYLWELRGQILFESGQVKNSIIAYKKALSFADQRNSLIKMALATSVINLNSGDQDLINFAIENLLSAEVVEGRNPEIFKQLALAYNQIGNKARSYLSLAELNLLRNDEDKARKYAKLAKENANGDKSTSIKANDILSVLKKSNNFDK